MKTVLITGGSSGIGFEISKYFAEDGYQVLWVSLIEEELQNAKDLLQKESPQTVIKLLAIDLSLEDSAQQTYDWVKSNNWKVDVLINNAGYGTFGFANDIAFKKELAMVRLNVVNVFQLTRLFLRDMLERNAGTIINISSNTSFQPVPKMAAYSATKAFVKQYSESLTEELKALQTNVKVMTVCPAAIKDTKFKDAAKMQKVKTFEGLAATTKEEVAKDVWNGFTSGKPFVASGAKLRRLMWLSGILPHSVVQFLLRKELSEEG